MTRRFATSKRRATVKLSISRRTTLVSTLGPSIITANRMITFIYHVIIYNTLAFIHRRTRNVLLGTTATTIIIIPVSPRSTVTLLQLITLAFTFVRKSLRRGTSDIGTLIINMMVAPTTTSRILYTLERLTLHLNKNMVLIMARKIPLTTPTTGGTSF
jgi:hypothetical protein